MNLPRNAYFKGQFVPYEQAKVGVLTHAFNYGTAVFGGVRGYWNPEEEQLFVFRPVDHYQRFLNSTKIMAMELGQTPENLARLTIELLRLDNYHQDVYIRPLAYKSDEIIGVKLHDLKDELSIVAIPFERYVSNDTNAHVTFSSWRRVDDNAIPARGKISGAYANSAFIKTDAIRAGFDEALVLTQEGHVSEGSAMNIFMLRNGKAITPPVTENILEGITRRTAMQLLQEELGVPVIERPIDRTEIYLCDEFFMTGTAAQVTAVTKVDHRPIGSGNMGPITTELRKIFDDAIRGRLPKYRHWNMPVYQHITLESPSTKLSQKVPHS
ncbi:MAG: branched-chain amino acid transaminase [Anaerolineales bacterium]|nr:MAG: branched-chain amino acid transaminase [Anaerolineales bacterium]